MAKVVLHPEARQEYLDAVRWYKRRSPATARQFSNAFSSVTSQVASRPEQFSWHDDRYREARLGRFPYVLLYETKANDVAFILAVAHTSRDPGYWRGRA